MVNKVMVLAGGNDQIALIEGIRKRFPGVEVVLIDMNPNVRAREYADKMLVISTMDFDKVLEAAKHEEVDLILSACGDQPLRTMAYISEKLGLPCYLTYDQAQDLTNKTLMKDKMLQGEIPTSKYKKIDLSSDTSHDDLQFPLVIKPSDNNGSKGIKKVYTEEEMQAALDEASKYSLSGELIIEEYKEGEEYSVEAFLSYGEPYIIFASKNIKVKNRNFFTICRNEYVSQLSQKLEDAIKDIIRKIGKSFNIDNVPLLIQMIVNGDNVNVIEFSARTGGGSKLFFIREMVGVDVIENLLDITTGVIPNLSRNASKDEAVIVYAYTDPGIFTNIEGLENLVHDKYISEVYLYKPFGSVINSSNYSSDRPVGFLIKGETKEIVEEKIRHISKHIKIVNEKGEDILRHDIFEGK